MPSAGEGQGMGGGATVSPMEPGSSAALQLWGLSEDRDSGRPGAPGCLTSAILSKRDFLQIHSTT